MKEKKNLKYSQNMTRQEQEHSFKEMGAKIKLLTQHKVNGKSKNIK